MIIGKVAKTIGTKAVSTKHSAHAFGTAFKAAPSVTAGTYAKTHKFGIGLTAVSFGPSPFHHSDRKSTHQGIQQKNVS